MKIERILSILFYLLNRESVSGSQLAKEFGVSRRTIIRDIDTLSLAGIPIYAETGVNGGYAIQQTYQLSGNLLTETNAQYLLLALTSLKTIYGDQKIDDTYEKVFHIFSNNTDQKLLELDFSVVGENKQVIEKVSQIKKAVVDQVSISFDYTSPTSGRSHVIIDPLHVSYKWYAWYVYGYSHEKQAMRQYKLIRIRHLKNSQPWLQEYNIPQLIDQMEKERHNEYLTLIIRYPSSIQVLVEEYLGGELLAEEAGYLTTKIYMQENNFMLFSILLGFGDQLQVLEPQFFSEKLTSHLEKALINNSKR
ncbi:YafY family transcriptional regulator [Vagococcus sp. BWB3-3]|uniref:YafY family transcriptional regulator n=1 Tax=Vagococcus allomyrinae TaxID=2794353 RepID=A0A940SUG7_9ENTE|nr:YafY family transcriptional regulator [Vagococcus allomyrinae]